MWHAGDLEVNFKAHAQLVLKARTEVTGFSILQQSAKTLMRLVSARTLDDLKKVSPDDSALDSSLSGAIASWPVCTAFVGRDSLESACGGVDIR